MEITDSYEQAVIYHLRQLKRHGHGKIEISYHNYMAKPIKYTENMHPSETANFVKRIQLVGTLQS